MKKLWTLTASAFTKCREREEGLKWHYLHQI